MTQSNDFVSKANLLREKGGVGAVEKFCARIYKLLFADICQLFALGRISISFCGPLVFGLGRPRGAALGAIKAGRAAATAAAAEQSKVKAEQQQDKTVAAAFHKWQQHKSQRYFEMLSTFKSKQRVTTT